MSFDFGLTLPDTLDYQRRAGSYWDDVQTRAQQEWNDRRLRDIADREGRMQRDLGRGNMDAYRQRRGQFDNHNSVLYGLQRGDQTPYTMPSGSIAGTEVSATDQAVSNRQPVETLGIRPPGQQDSVYPSDSTLTPDQRRRLAIGRQPEGNLSQLAPIDFSSRATNNTNRQLVEQYRRQVEMLRTGQVQPTNLVPLERSLNRLVRVNIITSDEANAEIARITRVTTGNGGTSILDTRTLPWDQSSDVAFAQYAASRNPTEQEQQTSGTSQTQTNANVTSTGTNTGVYLGTNDTSGPLQMTPDMELMDMSIQDSMRNAEVYARYGRNDLAEQAMNQALTGQAAMHQQENILLLRATAEGNMTAAARLVERLNGRRPNTARFVPTPEDRTRFVLMVRGADGVERSAYQTPITREELYGSFETAVDAVGAAQRRAASAAVENNIRDNQTRIYVADRDFQARALATLTEAETTRFRAIQERVQAAGGQMRVLTDGDGGVYVNYPEYNQDGSIEWITDHIHVGDVQTPGTNGTTTTQGLIRDRVTGTGNTTARAN